MINIPEPSMGKNKVQMQGKNCKTMVLAVTKVRMLRLML